VAEVDQARLEANRTDIAVSRNKVDVAMILGRTRCKCLPLMAAGAAEVHRS